MINSGQYPSRSDVSEQIAIIRTLAAHNADIKVLDSHGRTVLQLAAGRNPCPEIISCLIDVGANVNCLSAQTSFAKLCLMSNKS